MARRKRHKRSLLSRARAHCPKKGKRRGLCIIKYMAKHRKRRRR